MPESNRLNREEFLKKNTPKLLYPEEKSIIRNCVIELLPDGKGIEIKANPRGIEIIGNTVINSGFSEWADGGFRINTKDNAL